MGKIKRTAELGQSIWLDYIRRFFITSGDLQTLVDRGLGGVTSNPTIFEKAITGSSDYDDDLVRFMVEGKSDEEIYDELTRTDIAMAADILSTVYRGTHGKDGFVSLEVNPLFARDTASTIDEARRLFQALNRPNIMIKIPATPEGIPAIEALIGEGINVNVTLLFSISQYEAAARAYINGLKKQAEGRADLRMVASVASFFVSRVDTAVDSELDSLGKKDLQGKAAVANAGVAYGLFREIFSGPEWEELAGRGARVQRPLWASTGTKNPVYSDTLYVDTLIAPDTVNTLPPATLNAFEEHGKAALSLEKNIDEARAFLETLSKTGVDLDRITNDLLEDGIGKFVDSFQSLMAGITKKRELLSGDRKKYVTSLGEHEPDVHETLVNLKENRIMTRIWDHDHTVWKPEPEEITNRLGWLNSPENMTGVVPQIIEFTNDVREEGFKRAVLLGMGGSSLAPDLFARVFHTADGYLELHVLDSTDPDAVRELTEAVNPAETLFIVSTKSGTTAETLSFFKHFFNITSASVGSSKTGGHFIAITDPKSSLVDLAEKHSFREVFLNDPDIGGRYSALSYFGLVPAALAGVDIAKLLDRASTAAYNCEPGNCPVKGDNSGAQLGTAMGTLALEGRDKLTLVTSLPIEAFGAWAEQLLAESTGKEGKGILPVDGEILGTPEIYGPDRLFVYLRLAGDSTYDDAVENLKDSGHPVIQINLDDLYDLGGEFFRWEMATAVAGHVLGINPFDQPNVESAKDQTRQMLAAFTKDGTLPAREPSLEDDGIAVYTEISAGSLADAITGFLDQAASGDYVALQAYIKPSEDTWAELQELRLKIRDISGIATTAGYGPRFLHSTGQLHKGDGGRGLFIQITSQGASDLPIPDEAGSEDSSISFGVLKTAQAMGDGQALADSGRRVIRFELGSDVAGGIRKLGRLVK